MERAEWPQSTQLIPSDTETDSVHTHLAYTLAALLWHPVHPEKDTFACGGRCATVHTVSHPHDAVCTTALPPINTAAGTGDAAAAAARRLAEAAAAATAAEACSGAQPPRWRSISCTCCGGLRWQWA